MVRFTLADEFPGTDHVGGSEAQDRADSPALFLVGFLILAVTAVFSGENSRRQPEDQDQGDHGRMRYRGSR